MQQHGPWKILRSVEVHRDPWVSLRQDEVIRPDGKPGTFTVVSVRSGSSVLALDRDNSVYLTEEFRYALGRSSLEVVSGGSDDGEEPLATARRELKEELGIEADEWTDLGSVQPLTSMVMSTVWMYLARGLHFGEPRADGTEQIRRVLMPLPEAVEAVMNGRIVHAPSCVLILKADAWLRRQRGSG